MTVGDQITAYVDALIGLVDLDHLYGAVDALIARDSSVRWFDIDN